MHCPAVHIYRIPHPEAYYVQMKCHKSTCIQQLQVLRLKMNFSYKSKYSAIYSFILQCMPFSVYIYYLCTIRDCTQYFKYILSPIVTIRNSNFNRTDRAIGGSVPLVRNDLSFSEAVAGLGWCGLSAPLYLRYLT